MGIIKLINLEFYGYHGYYEFEREHGQRFKVDLIIEGDFEKVATSENLDDGVNYVEVYDVVKKYMLGKSFLLLEDLARTISREVVKSNSRILKVSVEVKKPEIAIPAVCDYFSVTMEAKKEEIAYIAFGGNIGIREDFIKSALRQLDYSKEVVVIEISSIYETPPWGILDQDSFLNGVVKVKTILSPLELLDFCQNIENNLFRKRDIKWGPRTIDLDIIIYGDKKIENKRLNIPHKEMKDRGFVLLPLAELDEMIEIDEKNINYYIERLDPKELQNMKKINVDIF